MRQNNVWFSKSLRGQCPCLSTEKWRVASPSHFWWRYSLSLAGQKLHLNDKRHRNGDICPIMGFGAIVGGVCFAPVVLWCKISELAICKCKSNQFCPSGEEQCKGLDWVWPRHVWRKNLGSPAAGPRAALVSGHLSFETQPARAARWPVLSEECSVPYRRPRGKAIVVLKRKSTVKSTLEIGGVGKQLPTRFSAPGSPSLPEPGRPPWEPAVGAADRRGSSLSPDGLRNAS